jgi:sugar phosphate permease
MAMNTENSNENSDIKPKYYWYRGQHLLVMIIAAFLFYFSAILMAGSTNAVFPAFANIRGWDISTILYSLTIAGCAGSFCTIFWGRLAMKKGTKFVIVPLLIITGISIFIYGSTKSEAVFIAMVFIQTLCLYGYQHASTPTLISNWFPRTKGIVLGWVTMGIILSDVTWATYMPGILIKYGPARPMVFVGIFFILFAIIVLLFVKNNPEEAGTWPDGSREGTEAARAEALAAKSYISEWTAKRVLTCPTVWKIIVGWGCLWLTAVCFLTQIVARCMSIGYEFNYAIRVMQIAGIAALFGSWLFGWLDQKLGTKKASQIYAIWSVLMFILALCQPFGVFFVWLSTLGVMAGVGGICNLIPSMQISIWGRKDFVAVNRVVVFFQGAIMASAFAITAFFMTKGGGFTPMYSGCAIVGVICFFIITSTKTEFLGSK